MYLKNTSLLLTTNGVFLSQKCLFCEILYSEDSNLFLITNNISGKFGTHFAIQNTLFYHDDEESSFIRNTGTQLSNYTALYTKITQSWKFSNKGFLFHYFLFHVS
jgi:hypothetical protein